MFLWRVRLRVAVETKVDAICLCIVKIVAIPFGPDDIEPTGRTGAKALTDGNIQFGLWVESTTEIVMGH
jgi:hypothetical protein